MARIGSVEVTNHVLRLYGGGNSDVLLEDGGDTWAIEPNENGTHQIYKIVVEQLARQGYRIVDISDGCTTLQLEAHNPTEDAGPTATFRMQRLESAASAVDSAPATSNFSRPMGSLGCGLRSLAMVWLSSAPTKRSSSSSGCVQ